MTRKLRIAVSVFFGLLTVALVVLWVRSYWRSNSLHVCMFSCLVEVWNQAGETHWACDDCDGRTDWKYFNFPLNRETDRFLYWGAEGDSKFPTLGFAVDYGIHGPLYSVPHWFLVLGCATIVVLPWKNRVSNRFSLRFLLIATTLVAVVLGLAAWVAQAS